MEKPVNEVSANAHGRARRAPQADLDLQVEAAQALIRVLRAATRRGTFPNVAMAENVSDDGLGSLPSSLHARSP
jgi:hypothetical protein